MTTTADPLRQVDELFATFLEGDPGPGVSYGVVAGGRLVHSGSVGACSPDSAHGPDDASVFRIASMTKSFTAAALLVLRDEGALALDDPVGAHVPELAGLRLPTADSPHLTVRHLLTMSGGLPTDDPWGDRLQGLPLDEFADLLRGGLTFAWAPGSEFEYSNLGYAVLGRVVSHTSGTEYGRFVAERLLEPLGMSDTGFDVDSVPPDRLVPGWVRRRERWEPVPHDPYGSFAAMGGLLSSVRDLARWVAWLVDAFPPRDDPEDGSPLRRSTRREMQQAYRMLPPVLEQPTPDARPALEAGGYGFGVTVQEDLVVGRTVAHSGGYPGFGSHMRWHPGTGLGVVALGNRTYAPVRRVATQALAALVTSGAYPWRRVAPSAVAAKRWQEAADLLGAWDRSAAAALTSENVPLDTPWEHREEAVAAAARLGPVEAEPRWQSTSPAHVSRWLSGEHGRVRLEVLITPERQPRVQSMDVTVVGAPSPQLRAAADALVGLLGEDDPTGSEPTGLARLALAETVDPAALLRTLRACAVRYAPLRRGEPVDGDGRRSATFLLEGDRGDVRLELQVDESGRLSQVALRPVPQTPPR